MTAPQGCKKPDTVVPVIDRNRCEGKEECVAVCPYGVFEVQVLAAADRAALSFVGKLKGFVHGYKQAFVVKPDRCHNCGYCVTACPEKAITLAPKAR